MKKYIFSLASILYVFPFQFNAFVSGPDIALLLSSILIISYKPLRVLREYSKRFPSLSPLVIAIILFQVIYILAFFVHGGRFPNEPLSDSLIRAARSLYPFFSMTIIPLHVFVLPKLINANLLGMLMVQTIVISLVSFASVLNLFGCTTVYGGICILNQLGYSVSGFISLFSIIMLTLGLLAIPPATRSKTLAVKTLYLISILVFLSLLVGAGSRAAVLSTAAFVLSIVFLGFLKPLLFRMIISYKFLLAFVAIIPLIAYLFFSGRPELADGRAFLVFQSLLIDTASVTANPRSQRYIPLADLFSNGNSFLGYGNFSYQPDPLGTSWYDGAYIWFQNNYGIPGLSILMLLLIYLLFLSMQILRMDISAQKNTTYYSKEAILACSAIVSFVFANFAQEVFALNTLAPFSIYVVCCSVEISLSRHRRNLGRKLQSKI
jgi:hypothetical protein